MLFGTIANVGMAKIYAAEEGMKRVFSIDAGRKYFSEEQLLQINLELRSRLMKRL